MCSQIQVAKDAATEVMGEGRRRMQDEMDEHSSQLEDELESHRVQHGRGLQSSQEAASLSCGQLHPPIQIDSMILAMSLPLTAKITIESSWLYTGRLTKDLCVSSYIANARTHQI